MMALSSALKDILQSMKSDITSTIQLTYLLPILRQKRLVTEAEFQQLSSKGRESDSEKNGKLIRIITGKGEDAYDLFVEALQEEQEHLCHSSLANKLVQERNRLLAEQSSKFRRPEALPRTTKPLTFEAITQSTMLAEKSQQQDISGVKYTLSVQDQNHPLIVTDERLLKQLNHRLSTVQEDVETIKEAVSDLSLEKKVEIAIENIENKLEKLTDLICSQREPTYHTMANTEAGANSSMLLSSRHQDRDEMYAYASNSNDYIYVYDTISETSEKAMMSEEELTKATYKKTSKKILPSVEISEKTQEGTSEISSFNKPKGQPLHQEGQSMQEGKEFDIDLIKSQTASNGIEAPNASQYSNGSLHPNNHSVSMHTKPIDGPCKIRCSGETGGIYYLRNHGLKLYFPPKCSKQNIEIVIHVYLSDKSPIKPGLQIASAVFKFQSNIKPFDEAVTLTIPHYIKIKSDEDKQKMCFVIQRGNCEPVIRRDGRFPFEQSYGSLKIKEFCTIIVAYDESKLPLGSNDQGQTLDVTNGPETLQSNNSKLTCKLSDNQPINGMCQQTSRQFQGQQAKFGAFSRDVIKYQVLLAFPFNRDKLTTSWCAAFYIFRSAASWKHHTIDSIKKEDKINFPLEIFSKEVDFEPLNDSSGIATEGDFATLKVENDPNAHWFVDPHPNKVEIQSVENLLDEVAYYSREYTDYSFLIQHKNPPRSLIYVKKRQLAGNCMQLNCQLEINGIKDIQQVDLIKTNKQGFKHEIINKKTNEPSVDTAKPIPEYYSIKPSMKLLHQYVFDHIAYKWKEIADILEFTIEQKELIKETEKEDPRKCCVHLFEKWLSTSNGIGPKTWGTLLEELDNSGRYEAAIDEIKRNLQVKYSSTDV